MAGGKLAWTTQERFRFSASATIKFATYSMPPRRRNEAFFAPASGEQALQKILIAARETGQCNLRGRQLKELPSACLDINSVALPEGGAWWDCRETLEKLDVSQNELIALPELASLPELRELLLNHNQLGLLPSLAALVELKLLEASHNRLAALPEDLGAGAAPPLARLGCAHNLLATLPRSLVGMTSLEQIDLSHNKLSALPDGLSALTQLRSVALGHNQLRALPDDLLAHLPPQLEELGLEHNRLGALALGAAASLRVLTLSVCHRGLEP